MTTADVLIIGGGIAGVSLAGRLAGRLSGRVLLLEREEMLAMHTTGRSAAIFSETYGNDKVRQWTREGRDFFVNPPAGFADGPLVTPRPTLFVARPEDRDRLDSFLRENPHHAEPVTPAAARTQVPVLREGVFTAFAAEPASTDIDVHRLFDGFRRMALKGGVEIRTYREVVGLTQTSGVWTIKTNEERYEAPIVVNAAGAWGGRIGNMAGLGDRGLQPLRRTAVMIEPPPELDIAGWPMVNHIGDDFYFKPDAGLILASPLDETPSEPCDAQPEEIDVATIAARLEEATTLTVRRIRRRWAGLRSFTPDRTPHFEFDDQAEGFFWLIGQGGYGIQTSPSISQRAADKILARL
ncbi:MAG: FAD-binding oxidoreductase [Pseudomonadota bacterium]|nr:FAD-binding oxidoreductase [Pseudomonadota bacterium]